MAHRFLTEAIIEASKGQKDEPKAVVSPFKEAYRKLLAETLTLNRKRILAFRNKPLKPPVKRLSCRRIFDAPDIVNDFCLNLLDWGNDNFLAIALGDSVYLLDAYDGSASKLLTVDQDQGPVTSISWAHDGVYLAVGLYNSQVQIWDLATNSKVRTLNDIHQSGVGSLAWNSHLVLTTGGMDGKIVNNDVRIMAHYVSTYKGHTGEVCGLKWSASGRQLASGANDNVVHVWDRSASSKSQWLHRLEEHTAAVKALAWCPFNSSLLATGGSGRDGTIKFYNTHTGACLNSIDTGSQVCSLLWNRKGRELLSSHGFTQNHLTLWKYPSLVKMDELTGHTSRVLCMAQSRDGCTVATAAADQTLRLWNVFGTP